MSSSLNDPWRVLCRLGATTALGVFVACGGGGGDSRPTYTIGGSVSNLTATGLVLHNNGGDALSVPPGATGFRFAGRAAGGGGYRVTVATQPGSNAQDAQDCIVGNGQGVANADVASVSIVCGPMAPLAVVGTEPLEGAADVSRSVQPVLRFSAPLRPEVANIALTRLSDGEPVAGLAAARGSDPSHVRLTSPVKLQPLTGYRLDVARESVSGLRGEQLAAPLQRQFTTADNTWKDIKPLTAAGVTLVGRPHAVALDASGDAIAAWVPAADNLAFGLSYYKASRGTWEAGPLAAGQAATDLKLAMDAGGNALLVWRETVGAGSAARTELRARRYRKGTDSWDTPQTMSARADGELSGSFSIAARADGKVAVAWIRSHANGGEQSVWLRTSTTAANDAWSDASAAWARMDVPLGRSATVLGVAVAVAPLPAAAGRPDVAVAWSKNSTTAAGSPPVVAARLVDSAGIKDAERVLSAGDGAHPREGEPQVAIDREGRVHAAWRRVNTEQGVDQHAVLTNTWHPQVDDWEAVNGVPSGVQAQAIYLPALSADGEILAWGLIGAQGTGEVHAWRRSTGQLWTLSLAPGQGAAGLAPLALASDWAGNVVLAWRTTSSELVAARFDRGAGQWQETRPRIDSGGNDVSRVLLVPSAGGDVLASWWEGSAIKARLFD
jgi:hypothetical protein